MLGDFSSETAFEDKTGLGKKRILAEEIFNKDALRYLKDPEVEGLFEDEETT